MSERFSEPSRRSRMRERRPRPFALRWPILFILAAILAVAWFAPAILLSTSLRDHAVRWAVPDFRGRVSAESASAGWMSPISIRRFAIYDEQGGEVATADLLTTEKTLFSLASEKFQQLGTIRIDAPAVNVMLRPDGSNIEDLLAPFLTKETDSSHRVGCSVEVTNGSVRVAAHAPGGPVPLATINNLDVAAQLPSDSHQPISARIKARVAGTNENAGTLQVNGQWRAAAEPPQPAASAPFEANLELQASAFPLDALAPVWQRLGSDVRLHGNLTTDLSANVQANSTAATIKQLVIGDLSLAAPSILSTDVLRLTALNGAGEIARQGDQWSIRNGQLHSDLGDLEVSGIATAHPAVSDGRGFAAFARQATGNVQGRIDLARLATSLPKTLRMRDALTMSSGELVLAVNSQQQGAGHEWTANLEARNVRAIHQGRSITWDQPIQADVKLKAADGQWSLDRLRCVSKFLELTGQGSLAAGELAANADLATFLDEIGQFVELNDLRGAGKLQSKMAWKEDSGNRIQLTGSAAAEAFEIASAAYGSWREPKLDIAFTTRLATNSGSITGVDAGQIDLRAASDYLLAELLSPVANISREAHWPLRLNLRGDVAQWVQRLRSVVTIPEWQVAGQVLDLAAQADVSAQRIAFQSLEGKVKDLQLYSSSVFLREPALQIQARGAYELDKHQLVLDQLTAAGTAVALRADQVRYAPQADGTPLVQGQIQYRSDLTKLTEWFQDPRQTPTYRLAGAIVGNLNVQHEGQVTRAEGSADIENLSYKTPKSPATTVTTADANWSQVWNEPQLQVKFQGAYDAASQQVNIGKLDVAGEAVSIGAAGMVREPFAQCDLQLNGQCAYDLNRLASRLRDWLGPQVQMTGRATRPFSFQGPLFAAASTPTSPIQEASSAKGSTSAGGFSLKNVQAEGGLAWETLALGGIQTGPADLQARLAQGLLKTGKLETTVSEGKLVLVSQVDFNVADPMVTIESGKVLDQVRISPDMCRSWLRYVAPLLADATAAEGRFSIDLQSATFPVNQPMGGNVQGQIQLHSAQIGPGPLAQEILTLARQIKAIADRRPAAAATQTSNRWVELPPQQLNFQIADQRVYHRDLQMVIDDVVIRTQGWVDRDQQLALLAEVPLRDEWIAQDPYLASLRGQTVKLPIAGTLPRIQIDRRALAELTRQTVREAGANFLQDQLNRQLNRLFQPQPGETTPAAPTP